MTAIEDALDKELGILVQLVQEIPHGRVAMGDGDGLKRSMERYYKARNDYIKQTTTKIINLIESEIIGDLEPRIIDGDMKPAHYRDNKRRGRNQLRKEQRNKLKSATKEN